MAEFARFPCGMELILVPLLLAMPRHLPHYILPSFRGQTGKRWAHEEKLYSDCRGLCVYSLDIFLWTFVRALRHQPRIIIIAYALFMILSGVCSILVYIRWKIKNPVMTICTAINGIYAAFGAAALYLIAVSV